MMFTMLQIMSTVCVFVLLLVRVGVNGDEFRQGLADLMKTGTLRHSKLG
jgi:hypothetical protein